MIHDRTVSEHALRAEARLRHQKREIAVAALEALHPADAAAIAAVVLDEASAGDPLFDAFGSVRASAEYWAARANPIELEAFFAAVLKRLECQPLGIRARKRLIAVLIAGLSDADKSAFAAWAGRTAA